MNTERIISILVNFFLILFILFTVFPVKLNYSSMCIIALSALALFSFINFKIKRDKSKQYIFVISIPLIIYILGLINTSNMDQGLNFISRNLSFAAFPLIFYALGSRIKQDALLRSFLLGLSVVNIYLWYLFIYYFNLGERFYMVVTNDIYHSTYLGMYNLFAYCICIYFFTRSKNKIYLLVSVFYILSSVITSARIIFILAFIALCFTISFIIQSRSKRIGCFVVIGVFTLVALVQVPSIQQKFHQIVEIDYIGFDKTNYQSISSRFGKIQAASTVIKKNLWFGAGTGDIIDKLVEEYEQMKFTMGFKYRYNPHNQYLDNLARNGLIGGTISLTVIYLLPLFIAVRSKNLILGSLFLVVSGVSMTESMLDVHKGITFYTFFITLLMYNENLIVKMKNIKKYL